MGRRHGKKPSNERPKSAPLISPRVDLVCGGGLSLLIAVAVMAYATSVPGGLSDDLRTTGMLFPVLYLLTDFLINIPHFMASYAVLYSRPSSFRKHPVVTIIAPIIAIVFLIYVGLWNGSETSTANTEAGAAEITTTEVGASETGAAEVGGKGETQPPSMLFLSLYVAPVVLGWHYVGQSWGTTACFAFLSDFRMSAVHRRLIRSGFYALFVYHVLWAFSTMQFLEIWFPEQEVGVFLTKAIMSTCRVAVLVCFVLGLIGFRMLSVEQQRRVPATVWLPWLATFSWYVMVDVAPASFFLLQIFHALQYLMFPARVEMNQFGKERSNLRYHMIAYYLFLVVIGFIAFEWTQTLQWTLIREPSNSLILLGTATMIVINLHHYFIDAVIWKIRDPEVRQAVFGHLEAAS